MVNLDHSHCSSSRDNQESDSSQSVGNNKPRGESGRGHKKSSESSSSETSASSGREHGHDDHDTDADGGHHHGFSSLSSDDRSRDESRDDYIRNRNVSQDTPAYEGQRSGLPLTQVLLSNFGIIKLSDVYDFRFRNLNLPSSHPLQP